MGTVVGYPIHEIAMAFSKMPAEDYSKLTLSIKEDGLIDPIAIWQGSIIDGKHRYQACLETGVEPRFVFLDDDDDPIKYVVNKNDNRRHSDGSQRAIAAYKLSQWSKPGGLRRLYPRTGRREMETLRENSVRNGDEKPMLNQVDAATLMDVSVNYLNQAGRVLRPESNATPELREALESGVVKVRDAAQIVEKPVEVQQEAVAKVQTGESRNLIAAVNSIDRQRIAENLIALPTGVYRTVVIDPPWPLTKFRREVRPNQEGFDYPTMSLDEIAGLEVKDRLADDAFVFLWTTQKYLPDSFGILEGWGLNYRFTMVWHKPGGIQPLNSPQFNAEFVVVGSKGNPLFADLKAFNVAFNAPREGHSVKPEGFYEVLRRVTAAPRLDMFSRRNIQGFETWGNENGSSGGYEPAKGGTAVEAGTQQPRLY